MSMRRPSVAKSAKATEWPSLARARPSDRNIASIAAEAGVYRPSEHRAIAEVSNIRVPGDNYDGYIESHVRRLQVLRRAGIVERFVVDPGGLRSPRRIL